MGKKSAKSSIASNESSKKSLKEFKVRSLNDNIDPFIVPLPTNTFGYELFDKFCQEQICSGGFVEKDYFGLRYTDAKHHRQWLELDKEIYKQLKKSSTLGLSFRVKHYPKDPNKDLTQAISKYLFYLQIRRDLTQGRLICPTSERESEIGALVYQAELGDSPFLSVNEFQDENKKYKDVGTFQKTGFNYISDVNVLFDETLDKKLGMIRKHIEYRGLTKQEAESDLLRIVSTFPTYGIDPFSVTPLQDIDGIKVKDNNKNIYLGLTHDGIKNFIHTKENHLYRWDEISDIMLDGKKFILIHKQDPSQKKKKILKFACEDESMALSLWKWSLDRKSFFTLKNAEEAKEYKSKRSLFKKAKSFKFSGHPIKELKDTILNSDIIPQPDFTRTASFRRKYAKDLPDELKRATMPAKTRAKLGPLINEQLNKENNSLQSVKDKTMTNPEVLKDFESKEKSGKHLKEPESGFDGVQIIKANVSKDQNAAAPLKTYKMFDSNMNDKFASFKDQIQTSLTAGDSSSVKEDMSINSAADAVLKIDSELDRYEMNNPNKTLILEDHKRNLDKRPKNTTSKVHENKLTNDSISSSSKIKYIAAMSFFLLLLLSFFLVMESKNLDPKKTPGVEFARIVQDQSIVKDFTDKIYLPAKESILKVVSKIKGS